MEKISRSALPQNEEHQDVKFSEINKNPSGQRWGGGGGIFAWGGKQRDL